LLVGEPGKAPRITEYGGRGPLRIWVRVVVARLASNLATRGPKETAHDSPLFEELPAVTGDPQMDAMRAEYRVEVERAFKEAARKLPVRDRLLLHQTFVERRTQEELGRTYEVHVNTMARWLVRAREALEAGIRAELAERLRVGEDELTSVFRLVRSQLDITLGALQGSAPRSEEP